MVSVGSDHSLGDGIQALGERVQTTAGTEGNGRGITQSSGVGVTSSNTGVTSNNTSVTSSNTGISGVREGSSKPGVWVGSSKVLGLG